MGLRLSCPNCGSRPYTEFAYGGEGSPADWPPGDGEADFARVWWRDNAAGCRAERWFHSAGCRRWLTVERDTRTNEIDAEH